MLDLFLGLVSRAGPIPETVQGHHADDSHGAASSPVLPGSSLFDFDFKFRREGRPGLGWGPMWFGKDIRLR